jgi:hypothetical protein
LGFRIIGGRAYAPAFAFREGGLSLAYLKFRIPHSEIRKLFSE